LHKFAGIDVRIGQGPIQALGSGELAGCAALAEMTPKCNESADRSPPPAKTSHDAASCFLSQSLGCQALSALDEPFDQHSRLLVAEAASKKVVVEDLA
jgi:hypothetical protein